MEEDGVGGREGLEAVDGEEGLVLDLVEGVEGRGRRGRERGTREYFSGTGIGGDRRKDRGGVRFREDM